MNLQLAKGTYILAVSGGVDSMVLLDLASKLSTNDYTFIVAHFDHGIRGDSALDAQLVQQQAANYGYECVIGKGSLGKQASEEKARKARYVFLRLILKQYNADSIVTAHHVDDLVETMLLHLQRGTGRQGLTPMTRTKDILRPLLGYEKHMILNYAN